MTSGGPWRGRRPRCLAQPGDQGFLGQADHLLDNLPGRRVIRPGLLAQVIVVQVKKMLIQMQVGVALPAADPGPVHRPDHAHQQVQSHPEPGGHVIGVIGRTTHVSGVSPVLRHAVWPGRLIAICPYEPFVCRGEPFVLMAFNMAPARTRGAGAPSGQWVQNGSLPAVKRWC